MQAPPFRLSASLSPKERFPSSSRSFFSELERDLKEPVLSSPEMVM